MTGAELLPLILLAVLFWLLLIRPQRKRQQQLLTVQRSLGVGDEVMTHAGFFGRVVEEVEDPAAGDCLVLELSPGTRIKVARGAVLRVVSPTTDDEQSEESDGSGFEAADAPADEPGRDRSAD